ncbi:cytochrome P450 [Leptodontidium sp. MPI-SDFR-AT-0119]|nr:cytochrome P450 [Leptodontidium sp. MPI-SDFR-AT-0119]
MFSLPTGPLILSLLGVFILYKLAHSLLLAHHNRLTASRLNCLPAPIQPNTHPLGIDHILAALQAISSKTFPSYLLARSSSFPHLTFSTSVLGTSRLFTTDIPNIQALLATQFEDFDLGEVRRLNAHPFLGKGIFLQDGKEWERSRALIRPQFARAQISDLELEERHFQILVSAIKGIGGGGEEEGWTRELDLQPLLFNLTLDAATEFLLGKSADSQSIFLKSQKEGKGAEGNAGAGTGADAQAFGEAFDIGNVGLATRAKFQPYPHLCIPKGWKKAIKTCNQYVDTIVAEHLRKRQEKIEKDAESDDQGGYVFLEALANETQDPIELRSQILHLLLAGRDTTASLIGWLLFELVRDQTRYKKLRDAIIEDFGTYQECDLGSVTFAKIKACKYLQYCLNEALRLQTIVPYNFREANKDTTLPRGGGEDGKSKVFVPKGMMVFYSIYVLHRREDIWGPDANEFVPERWEGRKFGWEYIPFNGGPRICVGQQYAIIEASYIMLRLLQKYDKMENMDPEPEARYHSTMTSCSANGVKVKLHEA